MSVERRATSRRQAGDLQRWSWKLARVAGIDVYMHATFLLLLTWVGLEYWIRARQLWAVWLGIAFMLALFACVVLHELGHALVARRYGIATRDITLLPIGGVARLERMPEKPIEELWVALAGPAVNVVIAAVLYAGLFVTSGIQPLAERSGPDSLLGRLALVNVLLVAFNLLPAFPMDGGRVLRALLAVRMEYTRATQTAASIGQGMAFVFGFLGLVGNPFLLFIALFVWMGATQEASMVQMRSALAGIPVSRAMATDFRTLASYETVEQAIDRLLAGTQRDFPVLENGNVAGVVLRGDLPAALAQRGPHAALRDVMRREFETVDSHEMLEVAFGRLQRCECHAMPVLHGERLVGFLTMENVGEFLAIQGGVRKRERERRAA